MRFTRGSSYPHFRFRRLRQSDWVREAVAEARLHPSDLVYPVFVHDEKKSSPIASLPGQQRLSVEDLVETAKRASDLGVPALAIFPVIDPSHKDQDGTHAYDPDNLVCRATDAVKKAVPSIGIVCDVALDPFTTHGQDGIVREGKILNDETNAALQRQAVNQAQAGCDVIAPSDMMDGRIGEVRSALDEAGHFETCIMSYAAKYASAFYGPFRDAVGSKSDLHGADKRTYQMDPRNRQEALHEVAADLEEGADIVMVKPGLPYLDIVGDVKTGFGVPTAVYHVSGEYSMIKAAGEKGWLDAERCMLESLYSLKRAGADLIFTYAAMDVAAGLG